jgi:hypothetical protein
MAHRAQQALGCHPHTQDRYVSLCQLMHTWCVVIVRFGRLSRSESCFIFLVPTCVCFESVSDLLAADVARWM